MRREASTLVQRAKRQAGKLANTLEQLQAILASERPARPQSPLVRLGEFLQSYRETKNLSRTALAREIDLSTATLKNLEGAKHWPIAATMHLLLQWPALPEDLRATLRTRKESSS